jgi:hypothetical protein
MYQMPLPQPQSYAGIIARAETVLSTRYRQSLSLAPSTPIQAEGRFLILRCTVTPSSQDIPSSVIIKHVHPDLRIDKRREILLASRNEQAALQVLTDVAGSYRYGPLYYTGDPWTGLLILEDLGAYPLVQDVLYGQNAAQASDTLVQYGRYLASMQLATRDHVGRYAAHVERFGDISQRDVLGWDVYAHLSDLHRCLHMFQIAPTVAFDQAIYDLAQVIQKPGPFYTLSHCDAGPHNIMQLPEQPLLIDFESACFQHGFVDLVQARLAFPSAGLGRRSSAGVHEHMERAYREELVKGIPEAADDRAFERAVVEACGHVVLTMIAELWHDDSSEWVATAASTPERDVRIQRLITCMHTFLDVAETLRQASSLRSTIQRIYDHVLHRWPRAEMLPYFPVFQPTGTD